MRQGSLFENDLRKIFDQSRGEGHYLKNICKKGLTNLETRVTIWKIFAKKVWPISRRRSLFEKDWNLLNQSRGGHYLRKMFEICRRTSGEQRNGFWVVHINTWMYVIFFHFCLNGNACENAWGSICHLFLNENAYMKCMDKCIKLYFDVLDEST